ncbi:MAG: hypothetical protein EHM28_10245, partial [Spirochaetaceae bacterium]
MNAGLTVTGTLTINGGATLTTGANSLSANSLTCTGSLNAGAQTGAQTLAITTNAAVAGTVTLGSGTVTVGGNLTGAGTVTGAAGGIDVNGAVTVTTFTASSGTTNIGGNFSSTVFNNNGGLVIFDGNGDTIDATFFNLQLSAGNRTSSGDWIVTNEITLSGGSFTPGNNNHQIAGSWNDSAILFTATNGTITLTSANPTITQGAANQFNNFTLSNGGNLATAIHCNSNLSFAGNLNSNSRIITVGGNWNDTGSFTAGTGTVYFDNAGSIQSNETFNNLEKSAGGTTTVDADIIVENSLVISGGVLNGSMNNRTITITGILWDNQVAGGGGFVPGNSEVVFAPTVPAVPVQILGQSTFYDFTCILPGATLLFEQQALPIIAATPVTTVTNYWQIVGDSSVFGMITLDSTNGLPYWYINIPATATAMIDRTNVHNSYATGSTIIPAEYSEDGPPAETNINWRFVIPVAGSVTRDLDNNGKIDAIDVDAGPGVNLIYSFVGFQATVDGYTVDTSLGDGGYSNGIPPGPLPLPSSMFRIYLNEGPDLDTGAVPVWRIVANPDLHNQAGGRKVQIGLDQVPTDDAEPVIGYTLAAAGKDEIFIRFSEDVVQAGGGRLTAVDFAYAGAANVNGFRRVTPAFGSNTREGVISLDAPVRAAELYAQTLLTVTAATRDLVISSSTDPDTDPLFLNTHRVSDLALGMPGEEIAAPVLLFDTSPREPNPPGTGGIGYITIFDGGQWIQDENTTQSMGVVFHPVIGVVGATLYWDIDVAPAFVRNGLWLPTFTYTGFNGLIPYIHPG